MAKNTKTSKVLDPKTALDANINLSEAADIVKALTVKVRWTDHPLAAELPAEVVAQQALFAAQRLLEQAKGWT